MINLLFVIILAVLGVCAAVIAAIFTIKLFIDFKEEYLEE